MAGRKEAERLFLLFFPGKDVLAQRFARNLNCEGISPAEIQAHLLRHADDPVSAAANLLIH